MQAFHGLQIWCKYFHHIGQQHYLSQTSFVNVSYFFVKYERLIRNVVNAKERGIRIRGSLWIGNGGRHLMFIICCIAQRLFCAMYTSLFINTLVEFYSIQHTDHCFNFEYIYFSWILLHLHFLNHLTQFHDTFFIICYTTSLINCKEQIWNHR